ncbi:hypothetical protein Q3G72_020067 [Acer saccharum]|nr:hypothetical protein Q3G72_020067 [Acer saccharum]
MADKEKIQIPRLKLGNQGLTGVYNAPLEEVDGIAILIDAFNKGITFFDTAMYMDPMLMKFWSERPHNSVDFELTVVLDPAHIPHANAAGGAAWLPYCVSVRLRYSFGENSNVSFIGMEGSHGVRPCWFRADEWEKCKQRVGRTVEVSGVSRGVTTQGRLRVIADTVQRTLNLCLQG